MRVGRSRRVITRRTPKVMPAGMRVGRSRRVINRRTTKVMPAEMRVGKSRRVINRRTTEVIQVGVRLGSSGRETVNRTTGLVINLISPRDRWAINPPMPKASMGGAIRENGGNGRNRAKQIPEQGMKQVSGKQTARRMDRPPLKIPARRMIGRLKIKATTSNLHRQIKMRGKHPATIRTHGPVKILLLRVLRNRKRAKRLALARPKIPK